MLDYPIEIFRVKYLVEGHYQSKIFVFLNLYENVWNKIYVFLKPEIKIILKYIYLKHKKTIKK